jgi:hypothetical protein
MRRAVLALLATTAVASTAFGQAGTNFTISDGNVIFTQAASPTVATSTGPTATDFRVAGAAGPDHLFNNWWWFRMDGADTRENAFFNQVGPTVVAGNTATRNYAFPSFSAALTYTVTSTGGVSGFLNETLVITPLTAGTLNIFNYADFFISGQDANDIVDVANPGFMSIRDTVTGQVMEFTGAGATAFQATPFNGARTLLTNAVVDNLNNTNTANTAGDREGAFQWTIPVAPGQVITLNERFVIPAPGAAALLGLGGLVAARRRRA